MTSTSGGSRGAWLAPYWFCAGDKDAEVYLSRLVVDFPAMAHKSNRQHLFLSIGLVNDAVVAHSKLE